MNVTFNQLVNGPIAHTYNKYGVDYIIFPQNFDAVPGICYKELAVRTTMTGEYKYEGKAYRVVRAYHPDYDINGNPIDKTASIMDVINYKVNRRKEKASNNPFAALAAINKEALPIKEEKIVPGIRPSITFEVGTKLLRPVTLYNTGRKEMHNIQFQKTDRGSYLIRAQMPSFTFCTDCAVATDYKKGSMVCFCNELVLPDNWIYFVITGFSKDKKTAFVKSVVGSQEELYSHYSEAKKAEELEMEA